MKPIIYGVLASVAASFITVGAIAQDVSGTYLRPSTGTQVQFYACGANVCGKVVAVKDPAGKANVGKVILNGAKKSGDNTWKGELLNLEDGNTYSGTLTQLGPKQIKLEGCALGGLVCKGETWNRVQ